MNDIDNINNIINNNNDIDSFGISVELDPLVAQDLRHREEERQRKREQKLADNKQEEEEEDDLRLESQLDNDEDNDEWNDPVLIGPPHLQQQQQLSSEDEEEEKEEDETYDNEDDDDDDDQLSCTPPDSRPVLWMEVERLVGYIPSSADERELLQQQIQDALWGPKEETNDDDNEQHNENNDNENNNNDPPLWVSTEFEPRVAQLLELGAARHAQCPQPPKDNNDSIDKDNQPTLPQSLLQIEYPPYFCAIPAGAGDDSSNNAHDSTDVHIVETLRVWKALLQPHPVPVVDRLLAHVRQCRRPLSWKAALRREVCRQARQQEQQTALLEWRSQRKARLERLYHVRDALEARTDLTRQTVQRLDQIRQDEVARQLRHQRALGHSSGGLQGLDWDSTALFSFADTGTCLGGSTFWPRHLDSDDDNEEGGGLNWTDEYPLQQEEYEYNDNDDNYDSNEYGEECGEESENANKPEEEEEVPDSISDKLVSDEDQGESRGTNEIINDQDRDKMESPQQLESEQEAAVELQQQEQPCAKDDATNHTAGAVVGHDKSQWIGKKGQRQALRKKTNALERLDRASQKIQFQHRLSEAAQEAQHESKVQQAKAQEEAMMEACTTEELRVAEAMLVSLEERMTHVDELLESLQEEEWAEQEKEEEDNADVETGETKQRETTNNSNTNSNKNNPTMTLLDQILAMVLGATPPPLGTTDTSEHVQWLHTEHQAIVREWKRYFGSLPPPLLLGNDSDGDCGYAETTRTTTTTNKPATLETKQKKLSSGAITTAAPIPPPPPEKSVHDLRQEYGLDQIETEHWEDDDEEQEQDETAKPDLRPTASASSKNVSFRPGTSLG